MRIDRSLLRGTLALLVVTTAFVGCNYRVDKQGATTPGKTAFKGSLDWNTVYVSSIKDRCANCHDGYHDYPAVVHDLAKIRDSVVSKRMPKRGGPLTAEQESMLIAWIDQGAPEFVDEAPKPAPTVAPAPVPEDDATVSDPAPTPPVVALPPATPTPEPILPAYTSIRKNIFEAPNHRCLSCHVEFDSGEEYRLDELSLILAKPGMVIPAQPDESLLIKAVTRTQRPMPPKRPTYEPLTTEEVDVLREWIRQGAPE